MAPLSSLALPLLLPALGGPRSSCPVELQCSEWAFRYFRECVCNFRDSVSLALGLASVVCWAVAEIPQIVTNFFAGSTEGVSLTFLLTWTVGDVFNLLGCFMEPATLPTQMYMAVMYTITTVVLVLQSVYYELLHPKKHPVQILSEESLAVDGGPSERLLGASGVEAPPSAASAALRAGAVEIVAGSAATEVISVPVPLSRKSSTRDVHISSARSLVSSHTPSLGSFLPGSIGHTHGGPHHVGSLLSQSPGQGHPHISLRNHPASLGRHGVGPTHAGPPPAASSSWRGFQVQPGPAPRQAGSLLSSGLMSEGASGSTADQGGPASPSPSSSSSTSARAFLSAGFFLVLFLGSSTLSNPPTGTPPHGSTFLSIFRPQHPHWQRHWRTGPAADAAGAASRRMLVSVQSGQTEASWSEEDVPGQHQRQIALAVGLKHTGVIRSEGESEESSRVGELLGWLMAAIYMGGRLPQIYLNIQRGTVEGLSPLMFLFALLGNVTYVGSIFAKSMAWDDLKPNLPWIVDAMVCVLLDLFILCQFVYYSLKEPSEDELDFPELK